MTRKCLVTFTEIGIRKTKKNEFLIPNLKQNENRFVGIETGKICQYGLVVYTGVDLDTKTIVERILNNKLIESSDFRIESIINDYLLFLKNCKVGDVIEISIENEIYKYAITGLRSKVESANIP